MQSRIYSGYAERSRKSQSKFSRNRVQSRTCSGYAERSRKSRGKNLKANFRASEHRAEFIRNLPSAAENIELVKIRATYKVAIIWTFVQGERRDQVYLDYAEPQPKVHVIWTLCYSCIFVKFVGK